MMKVNRSILRLTMLALVCVSSLLNTGFVPLPDDDYPTREPQSEPVRLLVEPLQQKKITSCGEAAITMAFNYLYPQNPLKELDVIAFAMENEYYIDNRRPYTSPENMAKIAKHYADGVSTGRVTTQEQGLALLIQKLLNGEPVIIDALTRLSNPYSGAHFVVVTGISMNSDRKGVVIIYYNDPLTARNESAPWDGRGGVWDAWQNNDDPGGSGWWMTIHATE